MEVYQHACIILNLCPDVSGTKKYGLHDASNPCFNILLLCSFIMLIINPAADALHVKIFFCSTYAMHTVSINLQFLRSKTREIIAENKNSKQDLCSMAVNDVHVHHTNHSTAMLLIQRLCWHTNCATLAVMKGQYLLPRK